MRKIAYAAAALLIAAFLVYVAWLKFFRWNLPEYLAEISAEQYNVLLITIDTLRADRLGAYGFKEISTPNIDGLARNGVLFLDTTAHVPLTLPSHTSIMTGTFPSFHGVHDNGGFHVSNSMVTMAELFKQNGFVTGAFVGAFVLDSTWGLNQGFDTYFDNFDLSKEERVGLGSVQRPGEEVQAKALEWLEQQKAKRFFLWVHLYDPHTPYEPPEAYARLYPNRPYVGEIAYTDSIVGNLLNYLESKQLREKTIILLTGDHGESLGEHGESTHAFFIYDATLKVPMILSAPRGELRGKKVLHQARSVDVAPTLLQMSGIPVPESVQGRSLLHLVLESSKAPPPASYAECYYPQYHFGWSRLLSLRDGSYKYIDTTKPELYDISNDPKELKNLYEEKRDIAQKMKAQLKRIEDVKSQEAVVMKPGAVDDETHEKLAALGYVGAFKGPVDAGGQTLPDPKDKIHLFNMMTSAREDSLDGQSEIAIQKFRKVLEEDPGIVDGHFMLGNEFFRNSRYPEAAEAFKKALELKPDYEFAMINLANAYQKMGKIEEAIVGFEYFLQKNPDNAHVLARIGELYLLKRDPDRALTYFDQALKKNPDTSWIYNDIGAAYFQKKEEAKAENAFRKALELNSKINMAHFNLAQVYESRGNMQQAEQEYLNELEISPKNYKASFNLGRMYARSGRLQKAVEYLNKTVQDAPDFGLGYLFLAQAHIELNGDLATVENLARTGLSKDLDKEYRPLGHYILADVYNRQKRFDLEKRELQLARQSM